jgi:histidinol-phosphate phosphatase family protein
VTRRAAVFLDRDGTLIEDPPPGFLSDPALVHPLPGAVEAVAQLASSGLLPIIVTNQSGIARGIISEEQYHGVAARVEEILARGGGQIAATYHCPHHPAVSGACGCRKPGTLLYREAHRKFDLDFASSWWVGDRISDAEPARLLGGRGIVITRAGDPLVDQARAAGLQTAPDIGAAVAVSGTRGPLTFLGDGVPGSGLRVGRREQPTGVARSPGL